MWALASVLWDPGNLTGDVCNVYCRGDSVRCGTGPVGCVPGLEVRTLQGEFSKSRTEFVVRVYAADYRQPPVVCDANCVICRAGGGCWRFDRLPVDAGVGGMELSDPSVTLDL